MPEHKHEWKSSYVEIGLIGNLYRHMWPFCCACGALKKYDGTILEPSAKRKTEGVQRLQHD